MAPWPGRFPEAISQSDPGTRARSSGLITPQMNCTLPSGAQSCAPGSTPASSARITASPNPVVALIIPPGDDVMRSAVGVAIAAILCSSAPRAQQTQKSDPFNGTWRLNVEKTKQMSGGVSPASELTTFRIGSDNVQHIHVEAQSQ